MKKNRSVGKKSAAEKPAPRANKRIVTQAEREAVAMLLQQWVASQRAENNKEQ